MFGFKNKRADGKIVSTNASMAGTLVIVIGVLLVFYILLAPDSDQFLGLNTSDSSTTLDSLTSQQVVLLTAHPGLLKSPHQDSMQFKKSYYVNDVVVKVVTQAEVIKKVNPFVVSSNLFSTHDKTIIFNVQDVSRYKNVLLSFTSPRHRGILYITLNGYDVASLDLSSPNPQPIDLTDYLQNGKNVLVFHVSRGFLSSDFYDISNFKITSYVTDFSKASASEPFIISRDALSTFDSASLEYVVKCFGPAEGKLSVSINGFNLSSTVPDCDNVRKLDFPVSQLSSGINYVSFETTGGNYLIYDIHIVPKLKSVYLPIFFFKLLPEQYDLIRSGGAKVVLNLTFSDDSPKQGFIYLNGYKTGFYTTSSHYSTVLDNASLQVYDNSIKIVPYDTLEITKMVVAFER